MTSEPVHVTGGVDTHADVHVAAVLNSATGKLLATASFPTTPAGNARQLVWLNSHGLIDVVGVESTGSYGAGLVRCLQGKGVRVVEVDRPDRKTRRHNGKTDTVDAIAAAQAALSGRAAGIPKSRDGDVESIRHLQIVHASALKARTQAVNEFHSIVISAPDEVREQLRVLSIDVQLATARRARQRGNDTPVSATCRWVLHELAIRVSDLDAQIARVAARLHPVLTCTAPVLLGVFGVGPQVAAKLLVATGDNPDRLHSEAAFAKLAGSCPIPVSSGKTSRHRLNRGGDRQANNALFTIALVRMRHHPPTRDYVKRRTAQGKTKPEIIRCLKRYIAREIYTAILHPPTDIPTGQTLRSHRQHAQLSLSVVCAPHVISPTELSRLERGLTHNNNLARNIEKWLHEHHPLPTPTTPSVTITLR